MCLRSLLKDLAEYASVGQSKKFQKLKLRYEIQRRAVSFSNALM